MHLAPTLRHHRSIAGTRAGRSGSPPVVAFSFLLPLLFCSIATVKPAAAQEAEPRIAPRVVESLDLERYCGLWYEIARIPNRFQKSCASNTTAEYTLRGDGRIEVVNRCLKADGEPMESRGLARIAAGDNPARLEVSFVRVLGRQLFWGDYWVIGLGEHYEYAIVGHPERKFGWILAREPQLDDSTLASIHEQLLAQGYDPERFVFSRIQRQ